MTDMTKTDSNCVGILEATIPFVNEKFGTSISENREKKAVALAFCDLLDWWSKRVDGKPCNVVVDDKTLEIYISILVEDLIVYNPEDEDMFYSIIKLCNKFGVKYETDDSMRITFVINGIWDKK